MNDRPTPEEVIEKLSTPSAVRPWMLNPETDDCVRDGFAPRGTDLRDFTLIRKGDECHFFYCDLRLRQHSRTFGQNALIGHAATKNFIDWEVFDGVLIPDPGHWDGRNVSAPAIIEHRGAYYLFYTGINYKLAQSIGVAISMDLTHFERYPGNPVLVPGSFDWCLWSRERLSNGRDPHVLIDGGRFLLYYTAQCKNGDVCVAAAESENLFDWDDRGPVIRFLPENIEANPLCLESSFVHKYRDGYVLCYSHDHGIWLNYSDSPLSFDSKSSMRIWDDHLGMEKVLELDRRGDRWLVAAFNQVAKERPSRLYFGVLDLAAERPLVEKIKSKAEMETVLARAAGGSV